MDTCSSGSSCGFVIGVEMCSGRGNGKVQGPGQRAFHSVPSLPRKNGQFGIKDGGVESWANGWGHGFNMGSMEALGAHVVDLSNLRYGSARPGLGLQGNVSLELRPSPSKVAGIQPVASPTLPSVAITFAFFSVPTTQIARVVAHTVASRAPPHGRRTRLFPSFRTARKTGFDFGVRI
ncbi:uncharacterized protein LY79DRAFT_663029 [Colletotrichum navitas]|uniref:Uncharacterized protein n=1 Tax=Colletotrichum navitas TaxID=681940 RepID=A0AAD8UZC4_9PEZI|nr:uncharacterized protein LY79DRAFT_663029 [Colletotrichum navitas]KAK1572983.1 hypothetical protein LY79DRAFT_663029 [Colletotrichum navitas]